MTSRRITRDDQGRSVDPMSGPEWQDWVSAGKTRNHAMGDPLLDWLDLYGEAKGFVKDDDLPGYDRRTDFTQFIFKQGHAFEAAVVEHLRTLQDVTVISDGSADIRSIAKAEETFTAMCVGTPLIHQGVLRDPQHRMYGAPDLLVRSDILRELFPTAISEEDARIVAPDLPGSTWHYRVVDIKFTTLPLNRYGELGNNGSAPAYKLQLHAYNRALGRLQGYEPPVSYLLGHGWTKGRDRGTSCMELLAPLPTNGTISNDRPISEEIEEACVWIRRLRAYGEHWTVLPAPSVPELYPDVGNLGAPWGTAKKRIAEEIEELTLLWQVSRRGRALGHENGLFQWTDARLTPALVGVKGDKRERTLSALLEVNGDEHGAPVRPDRISAGESVWRETGSHEFYVDFETATDIADDFTRIPERGGQPLIFMTGCGHTEDGEWKFECFIADGMDEPSESAIIDEWFTHMEHVRERVGGSAEPIVYHWSPAERSTLESAYSSAANRHPENRWPEPRWFDFLNRVIKEEPVVVRGSMNFGLQSVAKAMHSHGLVQTTWDDGPTDGLGAMVGGWWCADEAKRLGVPMPEMGLMQEIAAYNEVDCRSMMEIIGYLRANH